METVKANRARLPSPAVPFFALGHFAALLDRLARDFLSRCAMVAFASDVRVLRQEES